MARPNGFTILELMIALAVVGVLATLAYANYGDQIQRSNFKTMREVAAKLALSQQAHRQRYGRYASEVAAYGTPNTNRLIFKDASSYSIAIESADFRGFEANLAPRTDALDTPDQCKRLVVSSSQGYISYSSRNQKNQDSTTDCMPNG